MTTVTQADIERSRQDTLDHIARVQTYMEHAIADLKARSNRHDLSKLQEPELSGFAALHGRLSTVRYGTPEYQAALDAGAETIQYHYSVNDHHPNHHVNGIDGMSLLSLIEMLADWKAAGERTKDGSLLQSLLVNFKRYEIDLQLQGILYNTAKELGWL
jgi:hypothetical protein